MFKHLVILLLLLLSVFAVAQDETRPEGWSEASHGTVPPNYDIVFSEDEVKTLMMNISAENYTAMQENMLELYGEPSGERGGFGRGGRPEGEPPSDASRDVSSPADGPRQGGFREPPPNVGGAEGGPLAIGGVTENPMWVEATLTFEGQTWTHVGVRYKGNSTLVRSWNSETGKLPFKLDFDEFEDSYPEIDDQRFYGFKQLSLGNATGDDSFMRDTAAYAIMREMGLLAPAVTWYEVILDVEGEAPVNLGLYTVIEVIDDTVIETAYGSDEGNIYEANGQASTLAEGSLEAFAESFEKENNKDAGYDDLEALYNALHAESRLTNPDSWREGLEAVFDTDTFLKWLATNSAIQNWDTYGVMAHNYYLYHLPETGQLSFIGWDYNEAFQEGRRGGGSLSHAEVTDAWPLIRYLLDDPLYYAQYEAYLAEVVSTAFAPEVITEHYAAWAELLAPYVGQAVSEDAFERAVSELNNHAYTRADAVSSFLKQAANASQ